MATSDTVTYSDDNTDKPLLMVPVSIANAVARQLIAKGVSCALPGEDRLDGANEPLCPLSVDSYSSSLQAALEAWLSESGFSFKRDPEEPTDSPPIVDWEYTKR